MEPTNLPYIDLGASPELLRQYALDHFGKKISSRASDETVIDRFREIYKEETGVTLPDVAPFDDDQDDEDDDDKPAEVKAEKPKPTFVTINVHDDENDPHPITVGVQFTAWRIRRNEDVKIPYRVYEALLNAKRTVINPETKQTKEVPTYPFSVVEFHFE